MPPSPPRLSRASGHSALGTLGTLRINDIPIMEMCQGKLSFKFLMFRADGVASNQALIKWVCAESNAIGNLLIFSSICSNRSISNAKKWPLGDYGYGAILRTCHVLDSKQICRFYAYCAFLSCIFLVAGDLGNLTFKQETIMSKGVAFREDAPVEDF